MVIYNNYSNRPPVVAREMIGESITEQAGYIPPDIQVQNMLRAGVVLQSSREGIYDSDIDAEFDEDGPLDRLDSRGADMVDVHDAVMEAKERAKAAKKATKKRSKDVDEDNLPEAAEVVQNPAENSSETVDPSE